MGLLQRAVETYDYFEKEAGILKANETPLAPISHVLTGSDIEITIDRDGNYLLGRLVDKSEPKIIIPVTEESAGRTSAPCAHPLSDHIGYVAAYDEKKHMLYVTQLRDWVEFEPENKKLQAVLKYVEGKTILKDLLSDELIKVNEQGMPEKDKLMIRWRIECGDDEGACWKDQDLFQSFIRYYAVKREKDGKRLCMVSGKMEAAAKQHPKGIIPINGNAKLISANDASGFTYRGRFTEDWQSATVGYSSSQKAHNALRWIAANQGIRRAVQGSKKTETEGNYTVYGERTFLCWNPQGKKSPKLPLSLPDKTKKAVSMSDYKEDLEKIIDGYKTDLSLDDKAVIAVFDAATTGRLSVTYYSELPMSDLLDRLRYWDETCCWKNGIYGIQSPLIYRIVQYAYGSTREGDISPPGNGIVRQQMQRLISARIERRTIPRDTVQNLVEKTSRLENYNKNTRIQLLSITCAAIRKYHYDVFKEEIGMGLDENINDASYHFGRMLAVLEKAEMDTYSEDEKRETNALRYQSMFIQRPLKTWGILEEKMQPYYKKLQQIHPGSYYYYRKLLGEIAEKIQADETVFKKGLGELYILGYYHQREKLYQKKTESEAEKD